MRWVIQSSLASLFLSLCLATPGAGDPFEDGLIAFERGDWATAHSRWQPLAEKGDALAQYSLGLMYANGRGVAQNYAEAVKWFSKSADQDNALGQYNLGIMCRYGRGVAQDYAEAHKWFNLAAAKGNEDARTGRIAISQFMTPGQILEAHQLAREWNAKSGNSIPNDDSEDLGRIRRDAARGDANAQSDLGDMYSTGRGVAQDYVEALRWYRKSAEQGHPRAQYNLAVMYHNGHGVAKDKAETVWWWRKSAEQGYAAAQFYLGQAYQSGMRPEHVPIARQLVWLSSWLVTWPFLYYEHSVVVQDFVEAHKWFNLAAAQGDEAAKISRDAIAQSMTKEELTRAHRLAREWKPKTGH